MPALGLSNKAVHQGQCDTLYEDRDMAPATDNQYSESYFRELTLTGTNLPQNYDISHLLYAEVSVLLSACAVIMCVSNDLCNSSSMRRRSTAEYTVGRDTEALRTRL